MDKPACDLNTPPGEENAQRIKTDWAVPAFLCTLLAFLGGLSFRVKIDKINQGKTQTFVTSTTTPTSTPALDKDKFQLLELANYPNLNYDQWISYLDGIGFRPATYNEFHSWNQGVSFRDRQKLAGHVTTAVPSDKDSLADIVSIDYSVGLSMGKWGKGCGPRSPLFLIVRKDAPAPAPEVAQVEAVSTQHILRIDRSQPFNPVEFLVNGWSIWRGPADGDGLQGEEDQDARSLALTSVDLSKIRLESMLQDGEVCIRDEERLNRIKSKSVVRLDAKVLQTLWGIKGLIPESWKGRFIGFDGTVLRSPDGRRGVLYLYWLGDEWIWYCYWLGSDWGSDDPSAVLAE